MHMDTSFCGYRIEVIVDAAAQYQYEDGDHVLGEFHSEHHPSLQIGDAEPTKQIQQLDFNVGKFSHIEGQHYCFVLSAGRKWVLRESLLDKIYLHSKTLVFSVYLIQRGRVVLQCTSPTFQVHLSKHTSSGGSPRQQQMSTPKQQPQEEAMKISPQQQQQPTGLSLLGMLAEVAETERTTTATAVPATPTPKRQRKRVKETPSAAATAAAAVPETIPQLIEIGTPIPNFTLVVTPEWLQMYQIAQQNLPPPTEHDLNGIVYPDPKEFST